MKEKLKKIFKENNFEINNEKIDKFVFFYDFLIKNNEKFNLTRIVSEDDAIRKHFLDSVSGAKFIPQNVSVIDVGAGGGFPSIPLKIVRPDLNFTLLDSVNKKVEFLNEAINELNLKNTVAIHDRVEDFTNKPQIRESFDVCVSRAVANLSTLAEYCLPLVKLNGLFIAYKGSQALEELEQANNALKVLGGELIETYKYKIEDDRENYLLVFKKIRRTPKEFPRRNNKPRKQPL